MPLSNHYVTTRNNPLGVARLCESLSIRILRDLPSIPSCPLRSAGNKDQLNWKYVKLGFRSEHGLVICDVGLGLKQPHVNTRRIAFHKVWTNKRLVLTPWKCSTADPKSDAPIVR